MRALVVANNPNATAAIGQTLQSEGFHAASLRSIDPRETLDHLRQADCDAVVFVCDCESVGRFVGGVHRTPIGHTGRRSGNGSYIRESPLTQPSPAKGEASVPLDQRLASTLRRSPATEITTPPSCNGDCLVRQLRAMDHTVPLLVIAARGTADTWIGCLDAGADDYLAEPYQERVLQSRVRALVRRGRYAGQSSVMQVGDLRLDLITRIARSGEKEVELTNFPFRLLVHLMLNAGKVCSREHLLLQGLGYQTAPDSKVLEVHMSHLRADLASLSATPKVETVRGKGYRLLTM